MSVIVCDNYFSKCLFLSKWQHVIATREKKGGQLGSFGHCVFQDLGTFFESLPSPLHHKTAQQRRITALGDIHGDFLGMLGLLRMMKVIDDNAIWSGGNSEVIITGDWMDRVRPNQDTDAYCNVREEVDVLQFIHSLKVSASKVGGLVTLMIGNHDIERALGRGVYDRYSTEAARDMWRPHLAELRAYMAEHCPILVSRRNFLFMHGGITPGIIARFRTLQGKLPSAKKFSRRANSHMRAFLLGKVADDAGLLEITHDRSLARRCGLAGEVFKSLGLDDFNSGIVLGHTPQLADKMKFHCKGEVWLIDMVLSQAFGKKEKMKKQPIGALVVEFVSKQEVKVVQVFLHQRKRHASKAVFVNRGKVING